MKLNGLSNSHFILVGVVAAIIALFIYMWLDMKNLERSMAPETISASQTPTLENDGAAAPRDANKEISPVQRKVMEQKELAKSSADFFRRQTGTPAAGSTNVSTASSATDDWMFERGRDVTGAELTDSGAISPPE